MKRLGPLSVEDARCLVDACPFVGRGGYDRPEDTHLALEHWTHEIAHIALIGCWNPWLTVDVAEVLINYYRRAWHLSDKNEVQATAVTILTCEDFVPNYTRGYSEHSMYGNLNDDKYGPTLVKELESKKVQRVARRIRAFYVNLARSERILT